jgi:hypothetical protein
MKLTMAVWAQGNCVLNCILAPIGKANLMMDFEVWSIVLMLPKRGRRFATLTSTAGPAKNLNNNIWVSLKNQRND